ncbi:PREDICTED: vegetative cell wall protein gp1 isoform X1 [Theobroma cacao]|uniref:Vegetative cell wall protein gp1 isoform X1 n=1 Tax=Theobroma cacao TaxID=3641 RepID=A0AB32VTL7_THECC|nr:PREDICTED: vegetative cell wall protein gp1 isoform X1 [Theobroma cacao]
MSSQAAPARPWFRLASIARPTPPQAPPPPTEPAPGPPRPAAVRPTFRPVAQPQGTAAAAPPVGGVSSVPPSPVAVGRASQPSSPADRKPTTSTSSVPSSPVRTVPTVTATAAGPTISPPKSATIASVPSSPAKPVATTASVPTSPAKPVVTIASVPTSPAKPVVTIASVPSSPAKTAPTTSSVTSSPTQKPASSIATATRVPSPPASTTAVKRATQSPIQSPKIKPPTAPPPSPLILPPSQLKARDELEPKIPVEVEQKTVLVQTRIDKPKPERVVTAQKDLGDTYKPSILLHGMKEPSKNGETKEKGHDKKFSSDSEDSSMRVITIAGENKGAFMELIQSPHKNGFQGNHREQKRTNLSRTISDGSDYQSYSSSEEGVRKVKDKSNTSRTMPMNAFMNSNVQGVNNSIVYNSSCTHHDPGVHLSLLRKPSGGGFQVKERTNGYNS